MLILPRVFSPIVVPRIYQISPPFSMYFSVFQCIISLATNQIHKKIKGSGQEGGTCIVIFKEILFFFKFAMLVQSYPWQLQRCYYYLLLLLCSLVFLCYHTVPLKCRLHLQWSNCQARLVEHQLFWKEDVHVSSRSTFESARSVFGWSLMSTIESILHFDSQQFLLI